MANLLVAVAIVGCVVFAFGTLVGHWSVRTVLTGSMTPAIERGDVVLAAPIGLEQVRRGDVILFNAPIDGRLTVHRVDRIEREDGELLFQTRGDANDVADPWRLQMHEASVHRVVSVVPGLGGVIRAVGAPAVRVVLALGSALLVSIVGLRSIWGSDTSTARPVRTVRPGAGVARRAPKSRPRSRPRVRSPWLVTAAVAALVGVLAVRIDTAEAAFVSSAATPATVASGELGTPGAAACRWSSATALSFTWSTALSGLETGTRLQRSDTSGGTLTTVATATPATLTSTTITSATPVTTARFYVLATERGPWTSNPSVELRSDACAAAVAAFAGNGTAGATGDGGAATSATLNQPRGLATTTGGMTYIADTASNRIRVVDAAGTIQTFAGGPAASTCSYTGAVSGLGLNAPRDVAVDSSGNVYIADTGAACIRKVDTAGNVTRVAGGGATTGCANTGAADTVSLLTPSGVAVDSAGTVYIADTGRNCIRKVVSGTFSLVAGGGSTTTCVASGPATALSLSGPIGVAVDSAGAVYVADTGRNCIRKISGGTFTQVAGGGATTACATAVAGTALSLSLPEGVAVDAAGTVYISDTGRRCVRRISGSTSALVAFTGTSASSGDGGPAVAATMRTPSSIALTAAGDLLVSDRASTAGSNEVRRTITP